MGETGVEMSDWPVKRAIKAVEAGTDQIMVATTVWSPVQVSKNRGTKYLRTEVDSCDHSNLLNLPRL